MGKNSQYKSNHSRKKGFRLDSIDVHFVFDGHSVVPMSAQEAFHVMSMPAFEGFITSMVPNYVVADDNLLDSEPLPDELSEMPKE